MDFTHLDAQGWAVIVALVAFAGTQTGALVRSLRKEANADGVTNETLKNLTAMLGRLIEELGELREQFHVHDTADAKFHGGIEAEVGGLKQTAAHHGREIGQLQSQVRLRTVGANDRTFEVKPIDRP